MPSNSEMNKAKQDKADEFYTQLVDIELELKHYKDQFKDKVIFCNCDDPYESNFFKYFAANFNAFGLKKLIATCYGTSPIAGKQLKLDDLFGSDIPVPKKRVSHKIIITEVKDENGDGAIDLADVEYLIKNNKNVLTVLNGNGDFRSEECIELLDEADIVVTNPPFSLFREYVAQLTQYHKKFIIIGHQNAITYREIFPLIMDNKLWLGYGFKGNVGFFESVYEDVAKASQHKEGLIRVSGVTWFTNLETSKRHEVIEMYKKYNPDEYPKYINYDAIDVPRTSEIPYDYIGVMGVPITFLDKYNPEQFELIGIDGGDMGSSYGVSANLTKEQCNALFKEHKGFRKGKLCYRDADGKLQVCYRRILIRNKHPEV